MRSVKIILAVLLSLAVFACSSEDKDSDKSNASKLENSILNIPGAVSNAGIARTAYEKNLALKKAVNRISKSADSDTQSVYEGVRETIGGIEDMVATVEEMIVGIEKDILSQSSSGSYTEPSLVSGEVSKIEWGEDTGGVYDTVVSVYYWNGTDHQKSLVVHLTYGADAAKGELSWDLASIPGEDEDLALTVIFDGIAEVKFIDIKAVDPTPAVDDISKLNVYLSINSSEEFVLKGTYILNDANFFNAVEDRAYTFIAAGYTENYSDSALADSAVLNLAVPVAAYGDPAVPSETEASMWLNHSISAVFQKFVSNELRTTWNTDGLTVANLETYTSLNLTDGAIAGLPDSEVIDVLEWYYRTNPDDAGVASFIYVMDLVNSAYFNSDGFAGTYNNNGTPGDLTDDFGTFAEVPAWASDISLTGVTAFMPYAVNSLVFNSSTFVIE